VIQTPQKVYIESLKAGYEQAIERSVGSLTLIKAVNRTTRISIKPNLTFPEYRPGVMTNPAALEAVVSYLKNHTDHVSICESDSGGYNRFSMSEVFNATGITAMAKQYGVRTVNLSHEPSRAIEVTVRGKKLAVPLPILLLDETDLLITMPVPKIHMNTGVSISLKNQWGVIQEPALRLRLHPYFDEVIYAVNKAMSKTISIVDGKFGLNRSGPLKGDAVPLNWILMSDNVFAADFVCCSLMGIDPFSVPHLRYALSREQIADWSGIELNCDPAPFRAAKKFHLEREWTDYPGLLAFRSRWIAYLAYESPLAGFLHWLLYWFREPFYDYDAAKRS
jgi:uncharacterized protein (DUF362 family)